MYVQTQEAFREAPTITEFAFNRLLRWLDDGVDSQGDRYLEMRRRLVSYFDRRNRRAAEELADETLNRIARTLEESGVIATRPPARYCYVVARFVLLEDIRKVRRLVDLDEARTADRSVSHGFGINCLDPIDALREERLDCLDRCLQTLKPEQRQLIIEYYSLAGRQKIDRRRQLAAELGITPNALSIRASRIRDALMACVDGCCSGADRCEPLSSYAAGTFEGRARSN